MIIYPAEYNARKQAVFAALAQADGGGRRLWTIPWSRKDFPETAARTALCLSRAKRQPQGLGRWLKTHLIRLQYNGARRLFAAHPGAVAVAWNGLGGSRQAFLLAARDAGNACLSCELAPFPGRITIDPIGVNAESTAMTVDLTGQDTSDHWRAMGQGFLKYCSGHCLKIDHLKRLRADHRRIARIGGQHHLPAALDQHVAQRHQPDHMGERDRFGDQQNLARHQPIP